MAKTPSSSSSSSSRSTPSWELGGGFDLEILDARPGILVFSVSGKGADGFRNEAGGHRWQRVPPTEKKGRVQTSTVTVAVLREPTPTEVIISDDDLEWKTCRGSGAGGQKVNKTSSTVVLTHKPTDTRVRIQSRSLSQNKKEAFEKVFDTLQKAREKKDLHERNSHRQSQLGSGMRADKRRTIREQDGQVTDHLTGKRLSLRKYLAGQVDDLW